MKSRARLRAHLRYHMDIRTQTLRSKIYSQGLSILQTLEAVKGLICSLAIRQTDLTEKSSTQLLQVVLQGIVRKVDCANI